MLFGRGGRDVELGSGSMVPSSKYNACLVVFQEGKGRRIVSTRWHVPLSWSIGWNGKIDLTHYLWRLIQGILWADVFALVDGQLAVLLSCVVRLADPLFVAAASAASSSATAATLVSTAMRLPNGKNNKDE